VLLESSLVGSADCMRRDLVFALNCDGAMAFAGSVDNMTECARVLWDFLSPKVPEPSVLKHFAEVAHSALRSKLVRYVPHVCMEDILCRFGQYLHRRRPVAAKVAICKGQVLVLPPPVLESTARFSGKFLVRPDGVGPRGLLHLL
jgi:hypothetical protein